MSGSLNSRFGAPQIIALFLLGCFAAQGAWLIFRRPLLSSEVSYVESGRLQWQMMRFANDQHRSPMVALAASLPVSLYRAPLDPVTLDSWRWILRAPFVGAGLLLGASLWYVARRLYGNPGGYIALLLYCFSPAMLANSSAVQPEIVGTWGAFGTVFTSIALAHTLYAPRTVVLWNWPRVVILGISIALAIGARFSLWPIVVLAFAFILYLVPGRRPAAVVVFAAAIAIATALLWANYFFHPTAFWTSLRSAEWSSFGAQGFLTDVAYRLFFSSLVRNGPAVAAMLLIALLTYVAWRRPRYFGTTAPLIVTTAFIVAAFAAPAVAGFRQMTFATPFLFVFTAGVFTDLLETRHSSLVLGILVGLLGSHVLLGLAAIARA
jgi:hypothetical protein